MNFQDAITIVKENVSEEPIDLSSWLMRTNMFSIDEKQATQLANAFTKNSKIVQIDLNTNNIYDVGAIAWAETLKVNCTLMQINLSFNGIGDDGAIKLAKALTKNHTVTQINLDGNEITTKGVIAWAQTLGKNHTLTHLTLYGTRMDETGEVHLLEALKENRTLTHLRLPYDSKDIAVLIERNLNLRNSCHEAAERGDLEGLKNFLNNGVSLFSAKDDGNTLLHVAAREGHVKIVDYLLEKGLKLSLRNKDGKTPKQVSARITTEFLRGIGGEVSTKKSTKNLRTKFSAQHISKNNNSNSFSADSSKQEINEVLEIPEISIESAFEKLKQKLELVPAIPKIEDSIKTLQEEQKFIQKEINEFIQEFGGKLRESIETLRKSEEGSELTLKLQDEILQEICERQIEIEKLQEQLKNKQDPLYQKYVVKEQELQQQIFLQQHKHDGIRTFYKCIEIIFGGKLMSGFILAAEMIERASTGIENAADIGGDLASGIIGCLTFPGANLLATSVSIAIKKSVSTAKDKRQQMKYKNTAASITHIKDIMIMAELIARRLTLSLVNEIESEKVSKEEAGEAAKKASKEMYNFIKAGGLLNATSFDEKIDILVQAVIAKAQSTEEKIAIISLWKKIAEETVDKMTGKVTKLNNAIGKKAKKIKNDVKKLIPKLPEPKKIRQGEIFNTSVQATTMPLQPQATNIQSQQSQTNNLPTPQSQVVPLDAVIKVRVKKATQQLKSELDHQSKQVENEMEKVRRKNVKLKQELQEQKRQFQKQIEEIKQFQEELQKQIRDLRTNV